MLTRTGCDELDYSTGSLMRWHRPHFRQTLQGTSLYGEL